MTLQLVYSIGTEDAVNTSTSSPVTEDSYDRGSLDLQQDGSPSHHATTEDTRYAATRKRRLLLIDDESDNEEDTIEECN